ncbi:MAG TPA: hypothetical protein VKU89_04250 [Solirubrobacteraceae bacterium]|nr:hypothetical protein [Solirubrobacteraceae bacterium]
MLCCWSWLPDKLQATISPGAHKHRARARKRLLALEGRLWSGRAAHLLGGMIDFAIALARHRAMRRRARLQEL